MEGAKSPIGACYFYTPERGTMYFRRLFSCEDAAQQVLVSVRVCVHVWSTWKYTFIHLSTTSRMFHNVSECMQNVPECSRMHAESSRMFQNACRMHAECSRMFQNACRDLSWKRQVDKTETSKALRLHEVDKAESLVVKSLDKAETSFMELFMYKSRATI